MTDVHLEPDGAVFPLAEALQARGVPFVFATGYGDATIPEAFACVRRFENPCNAARMLQALLDLR